MTAALQEAFDKAAALPLERQETIAAVVLEEIEAEDHWQRSFAQSQDVLSQLAAEALAEDSQGRTLPMDEGS
jgi:predicted amidophosphoribosyltransferase